MALTEQNHRSVSKLVYAWTSDTSGDATATTTETYSGKLLGLVTVPDGSAAPSADYDVTVTDPDGFDVLDGEGVDRHTSNTESQFDPTALGVADGKLTFVVANGGDTKEGVVHLWIR
jgi:hypothetical protein